MSKPKTYKLEIDDEQAQVICDALEMYSRVQTGQLWAASEPFFGKDGYRKLYDALDSLKTIVFPGLESNASLGIRHPEVPDRAKIAWDMMQVTRHRLSWDRQPAGGWGVNFDDPFKSSQHPLARMTSDEPCLCKYPTCGGKKNAS